ncbi:creatininase family protein [Primorskyibacter sp. S87]|uniref:creatininase family protein n=1 Tax=Primorskyibacter sp. S87 TaxID=3415126 RepID=UPI003C7E300F
MQLSQMTWPELEQRLICGVCVMLPIGSTEQHGPMGLIGTDTICATEVARCAADQCDAIVAPEIAYTPAPFNTAFPGTVSISPDLTQALVQQVCQGLLDQGFKGVFVVNGHGANLAPIAAAIENLPLGSVQVQSWWAPRSVAELRSNMFGTWEGMHATPSEVAITQALFGPKPEGLASSPPRKLDHEYIRAHSGDRHGPPEQHRLDFPDGRVGSHSALATPKLGAELLAAAAAAIAAEFGAFSDKRKENMDQATRPRSDK